MDLGNLNLIGGTPFTEPLTVEEMRQFLAIPTLAPTSPVTTDPADAEIALLIVAAREQAEVLYGRDLVVKQWELTHDEWPGQEIKLRDPLATVESVAYTDSLGVETVLAPDTDYRVDVSRHPGIVTPAYGKTWPDFIPQPSGSIKIQFTSGYAADSDFWSDTGTRLKVGMKLLISEWWNNRLPLSYDIASGGQASTVLDRIRALLSVGCIWRF